MAKLTLGSGLNQYTSNLNKLMKLSDDSLGHAIYEGAAIAVEAINSAIDSIPSATYNKGHVQGITDVQREGLHDGLGIAKMRSEGSYLNVKIGFDGYNNKVTQKYPDGQPNAMIARAVESGASYRTKTPFVNKAISGCKDRAEKAMADEFDKQVEKIIN